jgi:D-glycero-beta-D-manno-heptose-7-phosphate kinase
MKRNPKAIDRLRKIVEAFPRITITVLGDMVADEFVFGEISRVSREAPVLILRHRDREVVPGGGANAVNNLADLGVNVLPVGVVGNDEPGRLLLRSFRHKRIPVTGILRDGNFPTVTKTRILAGTPHTWRQQVVRIDREPEQPPASHISRELALATREYLRVSDALLVSDYGYGAGSPQILNAARDRRKQPRNASGLAHSTRRVSRREDFRESIPVVLDSRHRMLEFSGITAATPNQPEVEEALRKKIGEDWKRLCSAGAEIISRMKLQSLVITRGRDGMVAFSGKHKPVDIPIFGSDEVADVTGAGDTVIATFTAALAAGATSEEAAHLANYAGGIVVMKRGTATVSQRELIEVLEKSPPATRLH